VADWSHGRDSLPSTTAPHTWTDSARATSPAAGGPSHAFRKPVVDEQGCWPSPARPRASHHCRLSMRPDQERRAGSDAGHHARAVTGAVPHCPSRATVAPVEAVIHGQPGAQGEGVRGARRSRGSIPVARSATNPQVSGPGVAFLVWIALFAACPLCWWIRAVGRARWPAGRRRRGVRFFRPTPVRLGGARTGVGRPADYLRGAPGRIKAQDLGVAARGDRCRRPRSPIAHLMP
jgi:hypothetical protein